jgi:glycosyltransferase involved in cell wall biosynthesis
MRVLFVIDSFYTTNNGTSISAQRFAGELRRRGHEVRVLCWDTPKDALAKNLTDGDFTTVKFRMPIFQPLCDKHDFSFAYNDTKIVHAACDWADIVHVYVPFGISMEAVNYCNKIDKPVTAAFHIQPENMTSSVSMGKVEWFNELFYRSFRRNLYNRVRHIHVPSEFMAGMIAARGYTAKIHPISNGIQDAFMEAGIRKKLTIRGKKADDAPLKIMMIGRLSQEKRQDVIINAVRYSKYADRIQLVFAGRGPEYDKYVEMGKGLKHQPQFIYVGRDELIEHLLDTDLYVHASDMESEAISCIEAFATGLVPVIANSHVSATPQFALDGRSLFLPGDPKDLARAIDYWFDHPGTRHFMEEQYRLAGRKYSLEASVTQFEQMLDEEIQEHKTHFESVDGFARNVKVAYRNWRIAACSIVAFLLLAFNVSAQERIEPMPFGNFETWTESSIKESKLIGGETKTLYKIGGTWGSSNAHAKPLGIDKVSVSVRPERRGNGWCCRMESTLEVVRAVGINFKALATGSIYTGKMIDVVDMKHSSDPTSAIDMVCLSQVVLVR